MSPFTMREVLGVTISVKMPAKAWEENVPLAVKEFFATHGNVHAVPPPKPDAPAPQAKGPPTKSDPFLPTARNASLSGVMMALSEHAWATFSARRLENAGVVELRFMLCRKQELYLAPKGEPQFPFEAMQEVATAACAMAGYDVQGRHFTFIRDGVVEEGKFNVFLGGNNPNWLFEPNGKPILLAKDKAKAARVNLVITNNGEIKATS